MAENKSGFVLYADQKEVFEALPDEQAGKLIKHIFKYVNDENPSCEDPYVNIAFIGIKQALKRDLKKWEARAERSRLNGTKGGRPKKPKEENENPENPVGFSGNPDEPKKPDSVSVSVSVSGNDSVIKEIYNLYPSKCPIKNTSTGKTTKNKDKIKSLLKSMSADKLTSIITQYIKESTEGKVYFKNFGTLLNNLPDYSESEKPKEVLYNYHAEGYGMQYRRTKKQMEHDRAICQGRISKITEIKQ